MPYRKILCIDFDGVIHSYTSKWVDAITIPDVPVDGAIDWLTELVESGKYDVSIYSSRSKSADGIAAMCFWLSSYGMDDNILREISFPIKKPAAFLTIDDRAICFEGKFPTQEEMDNFKPWNKRGV